MEAEGHPEQLQVEVVYALPRQQTVLSVHVMPGSTVGEALEASGLLERHPEIDLSQQYVGIFGQITGLDAPLSDGDRVEVYRPLQIDPKEARRQRTGGKGRG